MIDAKNIYKSFGNLEVLRGVSTTIKDGERVAIIGPSGSGKSTFLRCMNLLEIPTAGEVWLEDKLITKCDDSLHPEISALSGRAKRVARARYEKENCIDINVARRNMGMVFQHFNLFNNMTVLQNMMLAPVQLKLKTKAEAKENAMALLRRIGLEEKANVYPSTLSGGQKQRIAIVRALAMNPKVILYGIMSYEAYILPVFEGNFPVLLGFHGGKGIVCGFSVALCADWRCALSILAVFVICLYFTRYVSLSSILGAVAFCIGFAVIHWHEPVVAVIGVLIGLLAIFMHRANIKRLLEGTEKKATFSKFKKQK